MVSFYSSKLKPSRLEDFIKKEDWEKNIEPKFGTRVYEILVTISKSDQDIKHQSETN